MLTESKIFEDIRATTLEDKVSGWIDRVPLYQQARYEKFSKALDNRSPDWLTRLPFIKKADLRCKFPHNFLGENADLDGMVENNILEVEYTSGTSEERTALLLGYGWWAKQEDLALRKNRFVANILDQFPNARRVTINSPVCSSDICYTTMPMHRERIVGNALFLSLSRHPFLWSEAELSRMAAEAQEWKPVFLDVDPVYGAVFAQYCERHGIRLPSVKFILCSYEFVSVVHRKILERVFGVPVFNLYGATETGHLLMENESGEMIPSEETAFLEIVDKDARGIGELVGTTLTNEFMPLIRYRIADLAERHQGGSSTNYIMHGRKKDAFKRSDGSRVTTLQIDQLFSPVSGVTHYQLLELAGGEWQLRYVPDGVGLSSLGTDKLKTSLEALLDIKTDIQFQPTDLLMPEGSGKFRIGYPRIDNAD